MELINSKHINNYYIDNSYNKNNNWKGCDKFAWTAENGDWFTVSHAQVLFITREKLSNFKYDSKYKDVAWNAPLVRVKYEFKATDQESKEKKMSKKSIVALKIYYMWLETIFKVCKSRAKVYIINTEKHSQDFPVEYITKSAKNYEDLETCCEYTHSLNFDITNKEEIIDIATLFGLLTIDDIQGLAFAGCVFKKTTGMMVIIRFRKNSPETLKEFVEQYFKSDRLSNARRWTSLAPASV